MDDATILAHVDHTLLRADSSWQEIKTLCVEGLRYKTASVCVPPAYVKRIAGKFPDSNICTVIGFPLGYNGMFIKSTEARAAVTEGASEIDMVINLGDVKNGDFNKITDEISAVKHVSGCKILKVIIETCYLTTEEKIALCACVTAAGADYIKTSTGFGTAGAVMEDILLFREHIGPNVKIKAAGGIRTREDMVSFLDAGCDRLGTSSALKILNTGEKSEAY
ncbi:MAG: deoxyribose-phosphate aldolase [Clostridia bacterium]|nr:deoxyribose-phosphate aldolase [Clostridia bacterium]